MSYYENSLGISWKHRYVKVRMILQKGYEPIVKQSEKGECIDALFNDIWTYLVWLENKKGLPTFFWPE